MKKTLFAITAALLLTLPAACMHARHGRGPGGPGGHGCCCKCPQHLGGAQPDCPKHQQGAQPDCPSRPDCPKTQQAPVPPAK